MLFDPSFYITPHGAILTYLVWDMFQHGAKSPWRCRWIKPPHAELHDQERSSGTFCIAGDGTYSREAKGPPGDRGPDRSHRLRSSPTLYAHCMYLLLVRLPLIVIGSSLLMISLSNLVTGTAMTGTSRFIAYPIGMLIAAALLVLGLKPRRQVRRGSYSSAIPGTYPRGWGEGPPVAPSYCRYCGGTGRVWGEFGSKECLH